MGPWVCGSIGRWVLLVVVGVVFAIAPAQTGRFPNPTRKFATAAHRKTEGARRLYCTLSEPWWIVRRMTEASEALS